MIHISGREFPQKVIPKIKNSKNTIDIVIFDWRWRALSPGATIQKFNQEIVRAHRRGVKIRVITKLQRTIMTLKKIGIQAKSVRSNGLIHAKVMIIDDQIVVTGSHNYTQSAFNRNIESSVILEDPEGAKCFKKFFNNLWANS